MRRFGISLSVSLLILYLPLASYSDDPNGIMKNVKTLISKSEKLISFSEKNLSQRKESDCNTQDWKQTKLKIEQLKKWISAAEKLMNVDYKDLLVSGRMTELDRAVTHIKKLLEALTTEAMHKKYCGRCVYPTPDLDKDGIPDGIDEDLDGDGIINSQDSCLGIGEEASTDVDNVDSNNDGIQDVLIMSESAKAEIQDAFLKEFGYLLVDYNENGKKRFEYKEMNFILQLFRNYSSILAQFTDTLQIIRIAAQVRECPSGTYAFYPAIEKTINLCPYFFEPINDFSDDKSLDESKKKRIVEIIQAYLILHEFGHALHNHDLLFAQNTTNDESGIINTFLKKYGWGYEYDLSNDIFIIQPESKASGEKIKSLSYSTYGLKNGEEFWADHFAFFVLLTESWLNSTVPLSPVELFEVFTKYGFDKELSNEKFSSFASYKLASEPDAIFYNEMLSLISKIKSTEWRKHYSYDFSKSYYRYPIGVVDELR